MRFLGPTILIGCVSLLLSACAIGSHCACIDNTRFSVDYVGMPTQVEHSPPDARYGDGRVRLSDSTDETVYTDSLLTATIDLYKNQLLLTLHNRTDDSLRLSIGEARFIDANGEWPMEVSDDAPSSPAYDSSGQDRAIAGLSVPAGDTATTALVPHIAGKSTWEPIVPPKTLTFYGNDRLYDRLSAVPVETIHSTAAARLQEHFGTSYSARLPITTRDTTHRYTVSFEVRAAIIYGFSQNATVRETNGDSLALSRAPRDS